MKRLIAVALIAACGGAPKTPEHPIDNKPVVPAGPVELTTAEQVIEASLVSEGGRAKLGALTSLRMVGTLTIAAAGLKGKIETLSSPPNNTLSRLELPGIGTVEQGVHGDIAWEKSALSGARVLSGIEKSTSMREATFNGDLIWKKLFPKAELKGVVKFEGTDCYKVELTAADGQVQTRYYAKDTVLPIGLEMVSETQMGKIPVKVVSSDWREDNGYKFPHKVHHEEASQAIDIIIEKMETNVPIPPATFEPSDDIKQLAAAAAK